MSRAQNAGAFNRPYNLKLGPIAFTASAGVGVEFVDNVNLTATDPIADLIFRPFVGIAAVWQATRLNSLEFRTTLGYAKFLANPNLDSQGILIAPDSAVQFNLFIGDVKIVFREQFGFQDEPVGAGAISNVARISRFTNTLSANALWDLNDVIWSAGYSRFNLFTTGGASTTEASINDNLSMFDRATDQFSTSVFLKLAPTVGSGLEGTAAYTSFPKNSGANSTAFSLGPFFDLQLTPYTRIVLSGGYQLFSNEGGESGVNPNQIGGPTGFSGIPGFGIQNQRAPNAGNNNANGSGYYFTLAITHRLNRFYSDRLAVGRDFQNGVFGDRTETWFASYSSTFQLTRQLTLGLLLSYQRATQTGQFAQVSNGALLPNFDNFTVNLSTGYQLTRKLNVAVNYQFVNQTSEGDLQSFAQNRLALQFGYQF